MSLALRRKSTPADNGAKNFDWNGEIGCNVRVRMDFRARLVVYKHDNVVIQYGPAIRGTYRKRYSGTVTRAYGRVVAYLTGTFGFPADPNGAFGIASDPNSVNRNTDSNSYCRRIGRTFSVECHNIRSISFN